MTAESINRITIIAAGLLATIVFTAFCIRHNVPVIEAELAARARSELRDNDMGWAKVEIDGRDLKISGVAPDDQLRQQAAIVAGVYGVRVIDNKLRTVRDHVIDNKQTDTETTVALQPYTTSFFVADNRIALTGAVPDIEMRKTLVQLAQDLFGVAAVEVHLDVRADAPENWQQAAITSLRIAQLLQLGEIKLSDTNLHVTGLTNSVSADRIVRESMSDRLPENFSGIAETSAESELQDVLRRSPGLAKRLASRTRRPSSTAPATPALALEPEACQLKFLQTLGTGQVLFAVASTQLTKSSKELLDELAVVLKRCPGLRISIEGHTDDQGLEQNNLDLSQRRAEEVMRYLVSRGVSLSRLGARGFGESQPIVSNQTAADRATNRRIEFVFENL